MTDAPTLSGGTTAPLAVRMRPLSLDEVVGQRHLLRPGSPLRRLADPGSADAAGTSVILWGPPGTGKTTIAQAIAHTGGRSFVQLSAISAGVKDVRAVMEGALRRRDFSDTGTVLFLDEIHRFTKAQQDALLPGVEQGWVTLVAATTENPSFSVISPLLSRSLLLTLRSLDDDDLGELIDRAVSEPRGLGGAVVLEPDAREAIIRFASGDARRALTTLEAAAAGAAAHGPESEPGEPAPERGHRHEESEPASTDDETDEEPAPEGGSEEARPVITAADVEAASDQALLRYDRDGDQHYDVISAFIKSMRGSDPDAALHYLARMIVAGEDPRFIARRVLILAAEDIGMADPQALLIAEAAAQSVQLLGMPEGRIPLAEAVVYCATAPKSNAAYLAIDEAIADVRAGRGGEVPAHLRDAHYAGAARLGHGNEYRYPHDDPHGVLAQQYLPDTLRQARYYRPRELGWEREISTRLDRIRRITRGE